MVEDALSTCYTRIGAPTPSIWRRLRLPTIAVGGAALVLSAFAVLRLVEVLTDPIQVHVVMTEELDTLPSVISAIDGWLNLTLRVEEGTWHLPHGISFRTRMYNGMVPAPVLYCAPGDRVQITVQNRLAADAEEGHDNNAVGFHHANTTNLHLHGIFDSVEHDDTFARVRPGEERLYAYTLHPASGTALLYYHPHADGAISLQSFGGMGGALVVHDAEQEANLGLPVHCERVAMLMVLDFDPASKDFVVTQLSNQGTSTLAPALANPEGFTGRLLLVNGAGPIEEALPAGGWLRLKLINAAIHASGTLHLAFLSGADDPAGGGVAGGASGSSGASGASGGRAPCSLVVLAQDGVWLRAPRHVRSLLLPQGGRADVLVGCTQPGTHHFGSVGSRRYGAVLPDVLPVATLHVPAAGALTSMVPLPGVLPGAPSYYSDLRRAQPAHVGTIVFGSADGGNVVNAQAFALHTPPMFQLQLGRVVEWRLVGGEAPGTWLKVHPYHQHETAFQIVAMGARVAGDADDDGDADGDAAPAHGLLGVVGDWRDTLPLYGGVNYTIRFVAPFEGLMTIHCHIQKHAELGMMALAAIER